MALKEITADKGQYFDQERETLSKLREINDDHLIKPIAAYQIKGNIHGCFLFPWAEGGNLREFWQSDQQRPLKEHKMMCWVLKQLCGLCHALTVLHERNCRHGDLKPENILHFDEGDPPGTLRIAHVGLAKFHTVHTQQRLDLLQKTATNTATLRYISPEFVRDDVIPRSFDVWSMGCIFLEFLIWTVYGPKQLKHFNALVFDHFWEKTNSGYVVHSQVKPWIDHLSKDLAGSQTALLELLNLIKDKMLVLKPTQTDKLVPGTFLAAEDAGRSDSHAVHQRLLEISRKANRVPKYALGEGKEKPGPPPPTTSSNGFLAPGYRGTPRPSLPSQQDSLGNHEIILHVPAAGGNDSQVSTADRSDVERQVSKEKPLITFYVI